MTFLSFISLLMFLQKPVDSLNVRQTQTETSNGAESDEFNSFQFWRDPLPSLDSELLGLLVSRTNRKLQAGRQESHRSVHRLTNDQNHFKTKNPLSPASCWEYLWNIMNNLMRLTWASNCDECSLFLVFYWPNEYRVKRWIRLSDDKKNC